MRTDRPDGHRGAVVDAFVDTTATGNPAAVVLLDSERPDRWMQRIAAEFNQPETAFVIQIGPDLWGLRWFTPTMEVEICGHATLAAVHWLAEEGLIDGPVHFDTAVGRLSAMYSDTSCTVRLPERPLRLPPDGFDVTGCFRDDPETTVVGATGHPDDLERNLLLRFADEAVVRCLVPNYPRIEELPVGGVIATAPSEQQGVDIVARYFAPRCGIPEDPVTGSAYCTLIGYWSRILGRNTLVAQQVSERGGHLEVTRTGSDVYLTGRARTTLTVTVVPETIESERP